MSDSSPLFLAFGRVLQKARKDRGVSQQELALDCGLDRTFISLLERGKRQPSLTTLVTLGNALNVEANELVRATLATLKRL
jgi:transcriptional regulator with XRE-family HTH domain